MKCVTMCVAKLDVHFLSVSTPESQMDLRQVKMCAMLISNEQDATQSKKSTAVGNQQTKTKHI